MTENVSWLKKAEAMPPSRRTMMPNLNEINSTMTMNNTEAEKVFRPTKRKSCLMFQERRIKMQVPSEKKSKPNTPSRTEFRNRTLKMVQGRNSIVPRALPVRQRSQLPGPLPKEPQIQSTPLHMSTPRSILKPSLVLIRPASAAKKVNFDNDTVEEGVFPLQESTIQDFTQFDLRKPTVSKVDVGTNTDTPITTDVKDKDDDKQLASLFKQFERNILVGIGARMCELEQKIVALAKNSCSCKTPLYREEKTIQQFMTNLDAIREVSESVTPSIQEESESVTSDAQTTGNGSDTPKPCAADDACSGSAELVETGEPEIVENTDEKAEVEEPVPAEAHEAPNDENCSPVVGENGRKRRSARLGLPGASPADPLKAAQTRLRNIRKRNIPRYLQSFQLSPKPKGRPRINTECE